MDASAVPEECRFLLEINFGALGSSSLENKKYWLATMNAALKAVSNNTSHRHTGGLEEMQRLDRLHQDLLRESNAATTRFPTITQFLQRRH